ncbi:MAG: PIN domain nuclease [Bacteroidetes bacterium]|nr:MAG: PIN domain nuclease [Bacteroidota bacterium]
MRKLFLDTNIVLDLLAKRHPFYESAAILFSMADKNKVNLFVSSLTFANTNYVLSKFKSPQKAREILKLFKLLVKVQPIDDKIIELALNDEKFIDFEDGLQYYAALKCGAEGLITRDLKGFKRAKIPVMTAESYLSSIK